MAYIDTYKAVKTLIDGGFAENQAKAIVDIIKNADNTFAIKADMVNFRNELKKDIEHIKERMATKEDTANLRRELKSDIGDLKLNMSNTNLSTTKWVVGLYMMTIILSVLISSLIIKSPIN